MTVKSPEKTAVIAVYATTTPPWSSDLFDYLVAQGYDLNHILAADGNPELLLDQSPDAVITLTEADSLCLARAFDAHPPGNNHRPLIVRITDDLAADLGSECADVTLPAVPQFVERQLQAWLEWRDENARLHQRNQTLEREAARLSEELERQKHLGVEIEVLKNAIVRNVSHELKTPLLQVKSAVALIAEDIEDEELVNYAKGAMGRLEALVKNVTLLGSSLDVNPAPVIVRETVEYAKRNLRRIWEHHNDIERIHTSLGENLPPVLADRQGLSTVLQLLMDNALKFSKDDIKVLAQRTGNQVRISIQDHGIGIAQDQLDSIFDMFYQIDPSFTRRYGGTGIGLAIVQLILDRHNTRIEVDSKIGEGSVFSFMLSAVEI